MNVTRTITIARPPEDVYAYWRNFENLPRFMHNLESVRVTGDTRSHWVVNGPAGKDVEWDAEIVQDRPNELISWRSTGPDDDVHHSGTVSFLPGVTGRSTEVRVELVYDPPGGKIGASIAKLFGDEPGKQIEEDLERFRDVLEGGEVELDRDVRADTPLRTGPPVDPGIPAPGTPPRSTRL
jgi:uncharacterized membrane protein